MTNLIQLLDGMSDDERVRGRQFELLVQWYLRTAPEYRQALKHVWLWDEWPGRTGPDIGIDLVAQAHDGGVWAIQAKAHGVHRAIPKRELDSFLSASSAATFTFRLLVATTDFLSRNAERTIEQQEKPVGKLLRSALMHGNVEWPSSLSDLAPQVSPPKNLWPYQDVAVADVLEGFRTVDRGQLLMACGTGKTLVALRVFECLSAGTALVLTPSLSLLAQTLREWTSNANSPFVYLPVCSDDSVGDDVIVSKASDLGLPTTTEPRQIAGFLSRPGKRVVFATYHSSRKIADALRGGGDPLDLIVFDEAHRTVGVSDRTFSVALDDAVIPAKKRLFMTATPRYFTGKAKRVAAEEGAELATMDDEKAYGPPLHRLTFAEAVDMERLTNYRVVVVGVTDSQAADLIDRAKRVALAGQESDARDAREFGGQVALARAIQRYDLRRIITFHTRIKRASDFAVQFADLLSWLPVDVRPSGSVRTDYVSGLMPSGDRDARLRELAALTTADRYLLANAQCLTEGVDVPSLDAVAFMDPRRSQVDVIQAVGRVMRKSEGKTVGTIVIPVFIRDSESPEEALAASEFRTAWAILNALRAHDSELAEELDAIRRYMGSTGDLPEGVLSSSRIVLDVPTQVHPEFARAFTLRLIEATTETWQFYFGLLLRFADREGHASPPVACTERGHPLGRWAANQRARYNAGELPPHRVAQLEGVAGWTWSKTKDQFTVALEALHEYVQTHGKASPPQRYVTKDGFRLGLWVNKRRDNYTLRRLSAEHISALEAVPGWVWDARSQKWEEAYECLRRHISEGGTASPPKGIRVGNGPELESWVVRQRAVYRLNDMPADRIEKLEALPGWTWGKEASQQKSAYGPESWWRGMEELRAYVAEVGDANVPMRFKTDEGFALGGWVVSVRMAGRRGRLTDAQRSDVESLPGWVWNPQDFQWQQRFEALAAYAAANGGVSLPQDIEVGGVRMYTWIREQHRFYRAGRLKIERQQKLESLPGWEWREARSR